MKFGIVSLVLVSLVTINGCATQSSSSLIGEASPAWPGSVYITAETLPDDVKYTTIGSVKANARAGYSAVETLYPYLAKEAKAIGANAVVGVKGGRAPSVFSWAAPFTSGKAVRVEDPKQLESLKGEYY